MKHFSPIHFVLVAIIILSSIASIAGQPPNESESKDVKNVILEKDEISYCPWSRSVSGYCTNKKAIKVSTILEHPDKSDLTYYYFVSGGKIIGEGANVLWEFEPRKFGKYEITVGVGNDFVISGKMITKSFTFLECADDCHPTCECPGLEILSPTKPVKAGEKPIFEVKVSGGNQSNLQFKWTISGGTIELGQGTKKIVVKTNKEMAGTKLFATIEITGLCDLCGIGQRSASVAIE